MVLREVSVGFPDRPVLSRVSLSVRPGERVGVIGENGSGKSTPLRLLAGRATPDEGEVLVRADGGIGYLPQSPALPAASPVRDAIDDALAEPCALERRIRDAEAALGEADARAVAAYGDLVAAYEARDGVSRREPSQDRPGRLGPARPGSRTATGDALGRRTVPARARPRSRLGPRPPHPRRADQPPPGHPEEHADALRALGLFREEDLRVPLSRLSAGAVDRRRPDR